MSIGSDPFAAKVLEQTEVMRDQALCRSLGQRVLPRVETIDAAKARGLKSGYPQSRMGGRNVGEGARPRRHTHGP